VITSDTPETDNEQTLKVALEVFTELANTLKQEREEARKDAAQLADRLSGLELRTTEELARLEREREEAREALKHIEEYGTEEINAAVELRQKLASALVERDEAREEMNRYNRQWEESRSENVEGAK
jgi:uncharacterized coiled-coil DUF342 family protein